MSTDDGEPKKNYVVLGQIGSGSYGNVFKAQDKKTQDFAALKVIPIEHPDDLEEIVNEVSLQRSLAHPNILSVWGAWKKGKEVTVALELCEYGSARDLFARIGFRSVPETVIAPITRGLVAAVQYLHDRAVMHRDIKAGNVLITRTGGIKLSDFGVSCRLASRSEKRRSLIGTPHWLAPEVLACTLTHLPYDLKADIWSVGITMVELAEGRPPLWEIDATQVIIDVPRRPAPQLKEPQLYSAAFCDFTHSCLNKKAEHRPEAGKLRTHVFLTDTKTGPADVVAYAERTKQGISAFLNAPALPAPPRLPRPSRRQSNAMAQQAAQQASTLPLPPSSPPPSSAIPIPAASSMSPRPLSTFSTPSPSPVAVGPRPLSTFSPPPPSSPAPSASTGGINASAIISGPSSSSPPRSPIDLHTHVAGFMPSFSAPVSPRKITIPANLAAPPSLTELAVKPVSVLPLSSSTHSSSSSSSSLSSSSTSVPILASATTGQHASAQRTPSPSPPNQTSPLSSPKTSPRKRDTGVFNAIPPHMRSPQRERAFSGPSVPIAGLQRAVNPSPVREVRAPTISPGRAPAKTEAVKPTNAALERANSPFRIASPARERAVTGVAPLVGAQRISPARSRPAGLSSPAPLSVPIGAILLSSPLAAGAARISPSRFEAQRDVAPVTVPPPSSPRDVGLVGLTTSTPLSGSTIFGGAPPSPRSNYTFMPDLVRGAAITPPSPRSSPPQPLSLSPRSNYEFLPDVAAPGPPASSSLLLNLPSSQSLAEKSSGSQRRGGLSSPAASPRNIILPPASGRPPLPSWIALFLRCGIAQDKAAAYERIFLENLIDIEQMRDLNEDILRRLSVAPEDVVKIIGTLTSLAAS